MTAVPSSTDPITVFSIDLPSEWSHVLLQQNALVVHIVSNIDDLLLRCSLTGTNILVASDRFILSSPAGLTTRLAHYTGCCVLVINVGGSKASDLLQLGCSGFLPRNCSPAELRRAIDAVAEGELWFPRKALSDTVRRLLSAARVRLSPREQEVSRLMARGLKNGEIAEALFISRETVRWHVRSIHAKTGSHDRRKAGIFTEQ